MNPVKTLHKPLLPGIVLLIGAIVLGLCNYQDYGISWDEQTQRDIGYVSFDYVFKGDQSLLTYLEKDHGVGFELPLVMLEEVLNLKDISDVYLMRHLVTHMFFLLCVFCGYILALNLFGSKWLASLAFLMIAFHPRLYAHSFFNTKDIPFLAMFIVCFTLAEIAFRKGRWHWHLLLGIACGYTTSIRIMSILLIGCLALFYILDIIMARRTKAPIKTSLRNALVFLVACCLSLYITWPVLWRDPLGNLVEAFQKMSHFRWDGAMLFFGQLVRSTELPWTYVPGYFAVTVPLVWLVSGVVAILMLIFYFFRNPLLYLSNTRERNLLLYLSCGVGPVIMVILLKSVLYDDWRHLYFIYPSFVLLAVYAFHKISHSRARYVISAFCLLQFADIAWFMIKNHPHQQVYFNHLVSHNEEYLRKSFDLDYWGVSCRQGLEYILNHDQSNPIKVYGVPSPVASNTLIFNIHDRQRIALVRNKEEANYYFTIFRAQGQLYDVTKPVFKVEVLNSSILQVHKVAE